MAYKMLVLDMDDTLLTDDHKISTLNREMILRAQQKGIHVILASGRPTKAMIPYAKELNLDDSYMISYNGAVISSVREGEIWFKKTLSKEQVHDLYDFSIQNKTHIITYLNDEIISETDSKYIEIEKNITGLSHNKVTSFRNAVTTDAVKCILLEEPNYLKEVAKTLQEAMPNFNITMSKPFFLEVAQNGIDKATSLKLLAEKVNVQQSEIIAVGNAGNDLTMIQYAGLGIWVDNVSLELRDKADVIVASNNDNGVAEVIQKYILNQ